MTKENWRRCEYTEEVNNPVETSKGKWLMRKIVYGHVPDYIPEEQTEKYLKKTQKYVTTIRNIVLDIKNDKNIKM